MPLPTATATRRGSFTGDRLASCVKASGDISPGDGRVAAEPRVCQRAATRSFPGRVKAAAVRGVDVRAARARAPRSVWWISTRARTPSPRPGPATPAINPVRASKADASPLRSRTRQRRVTTTSRWMSRRFPGRSTRIGAIWPRASISPARTTSSPRLACWSGRSDLDRLVRCSEEADGGEREFAAAGEPLA